MADGLSRHQAEEQKQASEPEHNQWYTDIEYLVDTHYDRSDLVLKKLLEKLSQHAKVIISLLCEHTNQNLTRKNSQQSYLPGHTWLESKIGQETIKFIH